MTRETRSLRSLALIVCGLLATSGCAAVPKQTIELSEITEQQIASLQQSHIAFVELYYEKLRGNINDFVTNKWTPLFLSKAVQNAAFRKDLDEAYVTSSIKPDDVSILWKGQPLPEPQQSAVLSGIKIAISDERSRLGGVLLDFSKEAQRQIMKKRLELLQPVNEQEQLVIREIRATYGDLQRAQASMKAYLESTVELKQQQEVILEKLKILEHSQNIVNTAVSANETLSAVLQEKDDADEAVNTFLQSLQEVKQLIKEQMLGPPSTMSPTGN